MGLVVSRWQRYGQDRLYVNDDATREGVGFYDHQTGKLTLRDETRSMEVLEALRPFLTGTVPQGLRELMPEAPPPTDSPPPPDDEGQAPAPPARTSPVPGGSAVPSTGAVPGITVAQHGEELLPRGLQAVLAHVLKLRAESTSREKGTRAEDAGVKDAGARDAGARDAGAKGAGAKSAGVIKGAGAKSAGVIKGAGVKGDRLVDKRLGRLRRDGWVVLSSIVKRGGADIERLVIGPPGVFTVNTKNHGGAAVWVGEEAVKVDGTQHPYLRDSRHEAAAAERILTGAVGMEIAVTPVLAFVGAASIDVRQGSGGVLVVAGEDIDSILRERLAVFSIQERERILDAARRAEIWLA
jgi:hypothetical protein